MNSKEYINSLSTKQLVELLKDGNHDFDFDSLIELKNRDLNVLSENDKQFIIDYTYYEYEKYGVII